MLERAERLILDHARTPAQGRLLDGVLGSLRGHVADGRTAAPFLDIPLLVYGAVTGDCRPAIPLAVSTSLLYAGIDALDDLADGDRPAGWDGYTNADIQLAAATLLCSLPQLALASLDAPSDRIVAMQRTMAEGLLNMASGQQGDLELASGANPDPDFVEATAAAKSGSELGMFAKLAAQFAGAAGPLIELYAEIGRAMGTAGQIASDCHDLFRAPDSRDLIAGTRTLPIAWYLSGMNAAERSAFIETLANARASRAVRGLVRERLLSAGILRRCAVVVELHCQRARRLLGEASPIEPAGGGLGRMIADISFFNRQED